MKKIAFICDWMPDDLPLGTLCERLLDRFRVQTPDNKGVWETLEGVGNLDDSEVIIALGNKGSSLSNLIGSHHSKEIIQVRREPNFIEHLEPLECADHIIDYKDYGYHAATWWIRCPFNELKDMEYPRKKYGAANASAVSSAKWAHRNYFFYLLNSISAPGSIDFYGRGLGSVITNKNYKGELTAASNCKFKGLSGYKYSIAIENSSQQNYFTEKIIDCFLCWTIPLYWGCPNIIDYFPEDSYYNLDLNNPEGALEALARPIGLKTKEALRESRNLVLYKYNIWAILHRLLA